MTPAMDEEFRAEFETHRICCGMNEAKQMAIKAMKQRRKEALADILSQPMWAEQNYGGVVAAVEALRLTAEIAVLS